MTSRDDIRPLAGADGSTTLTGGEPPPTEDTEPKSNRDVALALAEVGVFVFPANAEKKPLVRWRDESTTDIAKIKAWWRQFPNALPAIDVGKSGLVVIDADRHGGPDGVRAFYELVKELGLDVSACAVVRTPSGGLHFYFRQPSED
jgi:hypothetical protein